MGVGLTNNLVEKIIKNRKLLGCLYIYTLMPQIWKPWGQVAAEL